MDFRTSQPSALLTADRARPFLWIWVFVLGLGCSDAPPPLPRAETSWGEAAARYGREIYPLLADRCVDCHHSQVEPPWYAALPWIGETVRRDVEQGRQRLDLALPFPFVPDGAETEMAPRAALFGLRAALLDGSMPPRRYLLAHPGARLRQSERDAVVAWLDTALAELPAPDPETRAPERVHVLLRERCARCHRSGVDEDLNGGFDFAADIEWLAQDEDYVVAEDPEASLLFERVVDDDDPMPPSPADSLSASEIELLERWIADGAEPPA